MRRVPDFNRFRRMKAVFKVVFRRFHPDHFVIIDVLNVKHGDDWQREWVLSNGSYTVRQYTGPERYLGDVGDEIPLPEL